MRTELDRHCTASIASEILELDPASENLFHHQSMSAIYRFELHRGNGYMFNDRWFHDICRDGDGSWQSDVCGHCPMAVVESRSIPSLLRQSVVNMFTAKATFAPITNL